MLLLQQNASIHDCSIVKKAVSFRRQIGNGFRGDKVNESEVIMKVNSMMVVMAVAIGFVVSGCCSLSCDACKKDTGNCCASQCGIGVKANVGGASAGAGVSTSGAHAGAKLGK